MRDTCADRKIMKAAAGVVLSLTDLWRRKGQGTAAELIFLHQADWKTCGKVECILFLKTDLRWVTRLWIHKLGNQPVNG